MRPTIRVFPGLAAVALSLCAAAAPPALPETPFEPAKLIYARPFTLEQPMEYRWSAERPLVSSGWILVLETDPAVAYPRQTALPVLYVGDQVARYAMKGYPSGRIVVLVPARVDLLESPIWFGTPRLPEQVDRDVVETERTLARQAGIGPLSASDVQAARAAGGPELPATTANDLETLARTLHERYSQAAEIDAK